MKSIFAFVFISMISLASFAQVQEVGTVILSPDSAPVKVAYDVQAKVVTIGADVYKLEGVIGGMVSAVRTVEQGEMAVTIMLNGFVNGMEQYKQCAQGQAGMMMILQTETYQGQKPEFYCIAK